MIKEKIIQTVVYMTSDGKEFKDKTRAEKHEDEITTAHREIETKSIDSYLEERYLLCYNIQNEEDFHYLVVKLWKHHYWGDFKGPGWYIVFRYDGGDHDDGFEVIKVDNYISTLEYNTQHDINELKNLTNL